jgi:hypothetical protein
MPKLSVTIIARDEERNLPRALDSVATVADEIVVTDTGSTDRTVEIARSFGARVAHFEWIDDFSAAHNYCNSLAQGDWILMLDADEQLLEQSRGTLRSCIAQTGVLAYSILRQDLVDSARPDLFTEMHQLRLVQNLDDVRFVGRFHHHFSPSLEELANRHRLELRTSEIRFRHDGYVSSSKDAKNRRAVHLLDLELRDRPGQFYYLVELGLTKLAMGDVTGHQSLLEAAQIVAHTSEPACLAPGALARFLEYVLSSPTLPADFPISRAAASSLVIERFPNAVPLQWHLAGERYAQGRFAECAQMLERILDLASSHSYDRHASFDPAILGDDARMNLGVCYVRLGSVTKARRIFQSLLASPTRGREAAANLRSIDRLGRR